jgi:putative tricarboxylic transport membrane protein
MLGFGLLGFLLESKNIPLTPFVIGFILGPIAEENLSYALIADTSLLSRPISILFLAVAVIMLFTPSLKKKFIKARMNTT